MLPVQLAAVAAAAGGHSLLALSPFAAGAEAAAEVQHKAGGTVAVIHRCNADELAEALDKLRHVWTSHLHSAR
jgi:hypothetical protein